MSKGTSITIDLALVLVVMLVVLRGYGRSWLATLFTYHKTDLQLTPELPSIPMPSIPMPSIPNPFGSGEWSGGGAGGGGGGGSGGFDGGGAVFPSPAGGEMTVSGEAEARERGWTPAMGTFGARSYPAGAMA